MQLAGCFGWPEDWSAIQAGVLGWAQVSGPSRPARTDGVAEGPGVIPAGGSGGPPLPLPGPKGGHKGAGDGAETGQALIGCAGRPALLVPGGEHLF